MKVHEKYNKSFYLLILVQICETYRVGPIIPSTRNVEITQGRDQVGKKHVMDDNMVGLIGQIYHDDLEEINAGVEFDRFDGNRLDTMNQIKGIITNQRFENAIHSMESMMDSKIFDSHSSPGYQDNARFTRSVDNDFDQDAELEDAISSFESLMKTATIVSHKNHHHDTDHVDDISNHQTRDVHLGVQHKEVVDDDFILKEITDSYDKLNKASTNVGKDNYKAYKLLQGSQTELLHLLGKIDMMEINGISDKINSLGKKKVKRSTDYDKKMISRGFNSHEYKWLSKEFNLSKKEVDEIKNLSEEQFIQFSRNLQHSDISSMEGGYTADDLIEVFRSARQLVPAELEAAAAGIVQVGRHLGGRARVAVDPVVTLVRDTVIPGTGRLYDQAVDNVPDDVKDWVGQGGEIASKRVDALVDYLGPRLTVLSEAVNDVQDQLSETANKVAPAVVPALKSVVSELKDALDYTRESLPEVSVQAEGLYNSVRDSVNVVEPYADRIGKTLTDDVGPSIKDAFKTSLNAVFTSVPKVITQLSHEAHDAAKVFTGNYQATLRDIQRNNKHNNKDL